MMKQFKITPEHKALSEKYKGMGYQIIWDIDGLWARNEIEMKFVPLNEAKNKRTKKTKTNETGQ